MGWQSSHVWMPGRLNRTGIAGMAASGMFCLLLGGLTPTVSAEVGGGGLIGGSADDGVVLVRSAGSGRWSDPGTWEGGRLPESGQRVQIRNGHEVVYDVVSEQVIRAIHVAGTLHFDADRDTRLDVGLIKIQPGDQATEDGFHCGGHGRESNARRPALLVGTPQQPIAAGRQALIRLAHVEGLDAESCPAIVSCGGRMEIHGAAMQRTWLKLGATAAAGDREVVVDGPVSDWNVGDRVIITATRRDGTGGTRRQGIEYSGRRTEKRVFTEQRIITAIEGDRLTLDAPLEHEHRGEDKYRGEVANLSRNVIIESADPAGVRGHTMYHYGSAGSISYAEFRHLGKEGMLGKYPIHFHLVRDTMRGSYVKGASIWDSHNRWIVIHGTDYMVARDNVGYQSVGHGYFFEDGTEVFNVLDRNLAVQAFLGDRLPDQELPFDRNDGAGFWWANNLNTFTRNVAVENDRYGFRIEATQTSAFNLTLAVPRADGERERVDIRTLPFIRFEDNESHSNGFYGVNFNEGDGSVGPALSHPLVVRNLLVWNEHYAFRPQAPTMLAENVHIHQAAYGVYHPNYDHHVYRNLTISETHTEPFNRGHDDNSRQLGPLAVDGLTFVGMRHNNLVPMIQISDDNATGDAVSHFRNVQVVDRQDNDRRALVNRGGGPRPTPTTDTGVPIYLHDWYGPGEHAKVLSTAARDFSADDDRFVADEPLTGDESRVRRVSDVAFPELLDPVDDLPPATIILAVTQQSGDRWHVAGLSHDNGTIEQVRVNGAAARLSPAIGGVVQWEAEMAAPDDGQITARATDEAGNREIRSHRVVRQADGLLRTLGSHSAAEHGHADGHE